MNGRRIDDDAAEVDRVGAAELVQEQSVQGVPRAGLPPLVQAVPQGHAAAPHLVREVLPGDAGLEHERECPLGRPCRAARERVVLGVISLAPVSRVS